MFLQPLCAPYIQLSRAFVSGKVDSVETVVSKFQENFSNVRQIKRLVCLFFKKQWRLAIEKLLYPGVTVLPFRICYTHTAVLV